MNKITEEFKVLDTNYVSKLENLRENLNTIAGLLNELANGDETLAIKDILMDIVDEDFLTSYLTEHPFSAADMNLGSIDITSLASGTLSTDTPIKITASKATSSKVPFGNITGGGATSGFVKVIDGNVSVDSSTPSASPSLPPHELVFQKGGNLFTFPTTQDPDIINMLKSTNYIPLGSTFYYMSNDPPDGYLIENGKVVKVNDYPELYDFLSSVVSRKIPSGGPDFRIFDRRGLFLTPSNAKADSGSDNNRTYDIRYDDQYGSWRSYVYGLNSTYIAHDHYQTYDTVAQFPAPTILLFDKNAMDNSGSTYMVTTGSGTIPVYSVVTGVNNVSYTVGNVKKSPYASTAPNMSTENRPSNICFPTIIRAKP